MVARTAVAATATVQREAVAAATVVTVRFALRLILLRLRLLRLAAGNKGRQPVDVLIVARLRRVLRPRLKILLLLGLRLMLLRLLVVLLVLRLAPIERLRLARRKRLAGQVRLLVVVAVEPIIVRIAAHLALRLLLIVGLALPVLLLGRGDQTKIVLGMLVVVFGGDRIAGTLRIAGELQVLFGDVGGGAADFHVRSIGLVHAGQWILVMMATFAVATPHALVLTVSHGLLFCQPPFCDDATAAASHQNSCFAFTSRQLRSATRRRKASSAVPLP
jgi:hypothetical protein